MITTNTQPALKGERCQCASCGVVFAGLRAFDRHRTGDFGLSSENPNGRRCRSAGEMQSSGMELSSQGLWRIMASSRPSKASSVFDC